MRTFLLNVIIVVGLVAILVQMVVTGYDRQFPFPGPVHTWQERGLPGGGEDVTVWGKSFELSAGEVLALAEIGRGYSFRVTQLRGLLEGNL